MNEQTITQATEVSFKDFLFKNKRNKTILILAGLAIVVQFSVFKYFYPFASFIHGDSFLYIETAYLNLSINTYMIGYSMFLRMFSVFSNSDTALVAFQYLLLQGSVLFLIFTIFYFYKIRNIVQLALLSLMVLNPLLLHLGNLVSSDGFFLALSLIWYSLLLWIIHKPSIKVVWWHAVVLFIAFTVRYNALIYPFIALIPFWLSKLPLRRKIIGVFSYLLLCGLFVGFTMFQYKKLTGYVQYSPFSGWQMANNAMYAYRYVDSADVKPVPSKYKVLDNMIRNYFDSTRDLNRYPYEGMMASTVYMWTKGLPLFQYRDNLFKKDSTVREFKKWASMGPFYKDYGQYIIRQYPWHFVRYFIWPNANKYFAPPVEFLDHYNSGKDSVVLNAQVWFRYKSRKLSTRMKESSVHILDFYPILSGVINLAMLLSSISFILLKGWRQNSSFRYGVFLGCTVWLLNAAFTIFASSAALRFQSFPILLTFTNVFLLVDWIFKMAYTNREEISPVDQDNALNELPHKTIIVQS